MEKWQQDEILVQGSRRTSCGRVWKDGGAGVMPPPAFHNACRWTQALGSNSQESSQRCSLPNTDESFLFLTGKRAPQSLPRKGHPCLPAAAQDTIPLAERSPAPTCSTQQSPHNPSDKSKSPGQTPLGLCSFVQYLPSTPHTASWALRGPQDKQAPARGPRAHALTTAQRQPGRVQSKCTETGEQPEGVCEACGACNHHCAPGRTKSFLRAPPALSSLRTFSPSSNATPYSAVLPKAPALGKHPCNCPKVGNRALRWQSHSPNPHLGTTSWLCALGHVAPPL